MNKPDLRFSPGGRKFSWAFHHGVSPTYICHRPIDLVSKTFFWISSSFPSLHWSLQRLGEHTAIGVGIYDSWAAPSLQRDSIHPMEVWSCKEISLTKVHHSVPLLSSAPFHWRACCSAASELILVSEGLRTWYPATWSCGRGEKVKTSDPHEWPDCKLWPGTEKGCWTLF